MKESPHAIAAKRARRAVAALQVATKESSQRDAHDSSCLIQALLEARLLAPADAERLPVLENEELRVRTALLLAVHTLEIR